ncbi:MAG: hypothetical protein JW839_13015, partial [Candidatus Lokiarchaeota archaeon]|nr:hypothetical protein [Candidatus Lokiarchaeota archaeon]
MTPFTGQACDECFARTGVLRRTRKVGTPYHEFTCTECGRTGGRHQVSARVAALLLKRAIEHGATASTGTEDS